jgi:hypothetical protein
MAAVVQNPGKKFQWAPLLQGVEGNGKTLLINVLSRSVGLRYTHLPNSRELANKFTGWLAGKLFIGIEEVYTADRAELLEALKPLITNLRIEIQSKGEDQITGDNRANFILTTNHRDAIRKTANDRRYCIFFTAQQGYEDLEACGMSGLYFPQLYKWFETEGYAIANEYLHNFQIPDEFNPAGKCHRAPHTSSTEEAMYYSNGIVEQEIIEAVSECRPGFCGGWISSMALKRLLEVLKRNISPQKQFSMLRGMKYMPHPAWGDNGRVDNVIDDCGYTGRPRLWITRDNPAQTVRTKKEALRIYQEAQRNATPICPFNKVNYGGKCL